MSRGGRLSRYGPVVAYCGLIFFLSAQSEFDVGPKVLWQLVFDFDKVTHAIEYGVLAALLLRATQRPALSLLSTFAYGVSDEVHQYFVPGRTASPFDALADLTGAGLVCALWYFTFTRKKRVAA
ncbi:MAG: VanZ family protein [Archangiaceae bacterium]|nr:VanZ family protein [Archangiaceae bacterium]